MPAEPKPGTLEIVEYLDRAALARLPAPGVRARWPSETGLDPLADALAYARPAERERLEAEARDFVDLALLVLKRDILPEGPLEDLLYTGPMPGLQLVADTPERKVRIDAAMNVAVVRRHVLDPFEGATRLEVLKAQLEESLCFALKDGHGKSLPPAKRVDLGDAVPHGVFIEVEPPVGRGFVSGRYEALSAFGDGKVLLVSFRPAIFRENNAPPEPLPFTPLTIHDTLGPAKRP